MQENEKTFMCTSVQTDHQIYYLDLRNIAGVQDTEPSSWTTCRMTVREERGWSVNRRAASQVSRTHCSLARSRTPNRAQREKSLRRCNGETQSVADWHLMVRTSNAGVWIASVDWRGVWIMWKTLIKHIRWLFLVMQLKSARLLIFLNYLLIKPW